MERLPIVGALIVSELIITTVLGCGVMPAGQASTRRFTVTGFILPVSMAYSGDTAVRARVPGIASSKDAAVGFVSRLVMQTVTDVLEHQGRSALLPDAVISAILDQLRVQISYEPLECKAATLDAAVALPIRIDDKKLPHCTIVGNAVTGTCPKRAQQMCMALVKGMEIEPISTNYATISGTLMTTNVIMANWSRQMWQNIVNRAVRILALSPSGLHFIKAFATVN